ncbi:MAG: hypothetical protein L0154_08645 [Chloroflexi bacterium]|nr:hypothetical protein [Chloroflexota bacterium]
MDTNESKTASTIMIWIATMVIFVAADPSSFMQVLLLLSALAGTFFIWVATETIKQDNEKAKRHVGSGANIDENEIRLRVLMDMLDDEDKARIRAKLMNGFSDGELPVDEFIQDQSTRS